MTEEQVNELVKLLEDNNKGMNIAMIMTAIFMVIAVALIIWELYRLIKVKKWMNEYKATLNEEQRKAINEYKEISK